MKKITNHKFLWTAIFLILLTLSGDPAFSQAVKSKVDPYLSTCYAQWQRLKKGGPRVTKTRIGSREAAYAFLTPGLEQLGVDSRQEDPIIPAIAIYEGDLSKLESCGASVQSRLGNFCTLHFPLSKLPDIANLEELKVLEVGKKLQPTLDKSDLKVRGREARNAFSKTGNGVLVGIIDTGIDISNPDFQNADGTTRILYIWDQTAKSGTPPSGYDYGIEWSSTQINNGTCTEIDNGYPFNESGTPHGTHVAGIAAGNGRATGNGVPQNTYMGMAPEADIILVKSDGNSSRIIDGLVWIGNKAASLNKPWVANLSLGTTTGPKDGTSLFEQGVY